MREDAAWSPILREQGALEELAAIGVEIIRNARNELYLSMRFLDVALNGLFPVADNSIKGIGTDGTLLSFETGYICGWYRRNPVYVNRMILHETFHCLFVHPWSRKKRAEEYWNLACDIAVESLIDGIHKPVRPSADVPGAGGILRTSEEKDQGTERGEHLSHYAGDGAFGDRI